MLILFYVVYLSSFSGFPVVSISVHALVSFRRLIKLSSRVCGFFIGNLIGYSTNDPDSKSITIKLIMATNFVSKDSTVNSVKVSINGKVIGRLKASYIEVRLEVEVT